MGWPCLFLGGLMFVLAWFEGFFSLSSIFGYQIGGFSGDPATAASAGSLFKLAVGFLTVAAVTFAAGWRMRHGEALLDAIGIGSNARRKREEIAQRQLELEIEVHRLKAELDRVRGAPGATNGEAATGDGKD